jgi:hypothetical protein
MKRNSRSSTSPEESGRLTGAPGRHADYIMEGGPITRDRYLNLAYPEGVPDPLPAEPPPELGRWSAAEGG